MPDSLTATLRRLAPCQPLAGVEVHRLEHPLARSPAVYRPSLKVVAQGSIRAHLGREVIDYDEDHFLVVALPRPVECEYTAPLIYLSLDLDWSVLGPLLGEVPAGPVGPGLQAWPLNGEYAPLWSAW